MLPYFEPEHYQTRVVRAMPLVDGLMGVAPNAGAGLRPAPTRYIWLNEPCPLC